MAKVSSAPRALICGSVAYDTLMVFEDRFKAHILPDKIHILNVSFLVPRMRREFGGCAGNIAYNLKLLGETGLPMATVGKDFDAYGQWMQRTGVPSDHIKAIATEHTAQAFITTDLDNNQITAFHPGAMQFSHENRVADAKHITLGIVAPDGRAGMIQHAAEFAAARVPFIFDPGQGLPMFSGPELRAFIKQASWLTVNDYEWQMVQEKTGAAAKELARDLRGLIVTRGAEGSVIYAAGREIAIPAAKPSAVVDPTGCGDAYRAGLLYGLMHALDWETTGRIASLCGALKIECQGTQNHTFTRREFETRYKESFGRPFTFKAAA